MTHRQGSPRDAKDLPRLSAPLRLTGGFSGISEALAPAATSGCWLDSFGISQLSTGSSGGITPGRLGSALLLSALLLVFTRSGAAAEVLNPMIYQHTGTMALASVEIAGPLDGPYSLVLNGGCDEIPELTCWAISVEMVKLFDDYDVFNDVRVIAWNLQHEGEPLGGGLPPHALRAFILDVDPGVPHPLPYRATFLDTPTHREWLQLLYLPLDEQTKSMLLIRLDQTGFNDLPPLLEGIPEPSTLTALTLGGAALLPRLYSRAFRRRHR